MPWPCDSRDPSCEMSSTDEPHRDDGVVAAAGRVALYPARAAMRASRTRLEASVENVLTGPELARIVDAVLAGPFPEELAHTIVERKVIRAHRRGDHERDPDRPARRRAARPARVPRRNREGGRLGGDPRCAQIERSSQQTSSAAGDVADALRVQTRRLDERVDLRHAPAPAQFGGVVSRAIALAVDALLISLIGVSISSMVTLIVSLVGTLRPALARRSPARDRLGSPQRPLLRRVLEPRRTDARDEIDARPGSRSRAESHSRSDERLLRVVGTVGGDHPCFLGFAPALFDSRRRGLPDLIAGTTVEVYAAGRPTSARPCLAPAPVVESAAPGWALRHRSQRERATSGRDGPAPLTYEAGSTTITVTGMS